MPITPMVIPPARRDSVFAGAVVMFGESFPLQFIHSMAILLGSIATGLRE
jgi:hypothetical protein